VTLHKILAIILVGALAACGNTGPGLEDAPAPKPSPPPVAIATGSATLSWTAPTSYTDGTRIPALSGYKIYYSPDVKDVAQRRSLPALLAPSMDNIALEELTSGLWYFAISAVDIDNVEGELSVILSKEIREGELARPLLRCENAYEYGRYEMRCQ
jgi:predicted small lipoprotein YifL